MKLLRLFVLVALVGGLVAVQGAPVSAGDEDDDAVGYTVGATFANGPLSCNFYKVELDTGKLHQISHAPVPCADGLTFDEDGELYAYRNANFAAAVSPADLITIDLDDGSQRLVGKLPPVNIGNGGMTFDDEGHLWLYSRAFGDPACNNLSCLWRVDPDDASTKFVGAAPIERDVTGLAADCEDVLAIDTLGLAGASTANGAPRVFLNEVDTDNGALTHTIELFSMTSPTGLDFAENGDLWALAGGPHVAGIGAMFTYKIDPDHGSTISHQITLNGTPFEGFLLGLAIDPISCDEPGPEPSPQPAPVVVAPTFTG